ncbi:uncharacterized protein LOC128198741 [Bicyclus anynana]|uniref:Uncharacterized protein LOC128198741 n=1 Tax=Bicyclus anynana TaxID=110368 RepID=A0ABM3LR00_BICAN|nr:uncharacterized protein LOC128198741 [Bicyclus anynana]
MEGSQDKQFPMKTFYYPLDLSDEEDNSILNSKKTSTKRNNSIEVFFEKQKKRKKGGNSSSVARACDGGLSYISSGDGESADATRMIKIDVFDMKSLKGISPQDFWKYADLRLKYFVKSEDDKHYQSTQEIIYGITKQIAEKQGCKKYFIDRNPKSQ